MSNMHGRKTMCEEGRTNEVSLKGKTCILTPTPTAKALTCSALDASRMQVKTESGTVLQPNNLISS